MGKSKREKRDSDAVDEQPSIKKVKTESAADDSVADAVDTEQPAATGVGGDYRLWSELSYDQKLQYTSVIAKPMATRKLAKRLFKLMRKSAKLSRKTLLRVGLKEVQLRIRKGETGIAVFAGDVTPIDVMCHLPAVCEDKQIPYVYVPLRSDISNAIGIKRPALMVLIRQSTEYGDLYTDCFNEIKSLPIPVA